MGVSAATTVVTPPDAPDVGVGLSIAEVAERTGVTAHTLRYYERIGLLAVPRDAAGHRLYTQDDAEPGRVHHPAAPDGDADPRHPGLLRASSPRAPGNEDQRLALLERHRDQVKAHIVELESALGVVEYKIATYGGNCLP